jgi:hypothetical protein
MFRTGLTRRIGFTMVVISIVIVVVISTLLFNWMFRAGTESQPALAVAGPPQLVYTQQTAQGTEVAAAARDGAARQVIKSVSQPDERFRLDRLDEILPSPDGRRLAFNRYECTWGETVECRA